MSSSSPLEMPDQFVLAIKDQHFFYFIFASCKSALDSPHVINDATKKETTTKEEAKSNSAHLVVSQQRVEHKANIKSNERFS